MDNRSLEGWGSGRGRKLALYPLSIIRSLAQGAQCSWGHPPPTGLGFFTWPLLLKDRKGPPSDGVVGTDRTSMHRTAAARTAVKTRHQKVKEHGVTLQLSWKCAHAHTAPRQHVDWID